uniref:Uncharacterized protein n=1 Tax=Bracon brevicornis TaxID=1563983 RepID=A0A6V7LP82_9HYME
MAARRVMGSAMETAIDISLRFPSPAWDCTVLHIKRGRIDGEGKDVQLIDGNIVKHLDIGSYRNLGFNQGSIVDEVRVREALHSEYKRRLRRVWRSELCGKNEVVATNMFAVPVLLYSFGVQMKWI